jgi:hypothetical protein
VTELASIRAPDDERPLQFKARRARGGLRACIDGLIEQALYWHGLPPEWRGPPLQKAIKITTGIGKSHYLRQAIAYYVCEAKRLGLPHRVVIFVPTHRLGDEARTRMPADITTALWQGRSATHPVTGEPMCQNLTVVEAALKIGVDVGKTVCGKGETKCAFYGTCGYQRQKEKVRAADVVFAAHEVMFQRKPEAFGNGFGLIVTDEAFWPDGLSHGTRLNIHGLLSDLRDFPVLHNGTGQVNADEQGHLLDIVERTVKAFEAMPDGYISKGALLAQGLLPSANGEEGSFTAAHKYEWRRKPKPALGQQSSVQEWRQAAAEQRPLGRIRPHAALWRVLEELLEGPDNITGRARLEVDDDARYVRLFLRKEINPAFAALPHIHADATMSMELVAYYLPYLVNALDVDIEAPHATMTQVIGKSAGKTWLTVREGSQYVEETTRRQDQLIDFVRHLTNGRSGLVITYKQFDDRFGEIENVDAAHYGAIEGLDRWRDVEVLVVIGRPLPSPADIEAMAAALTGKPITVGEMVEQTKAVLLTSGDAYLLPCRVYEAPEAEMIRQAITEAAVVQAVGRARAVNRTSSSPVEVFMVLNDTVTPLPVDRVAEFDDLKPDRFDEMVARGLVPEFPGDAAALYPDLFKSAIAARLAYHRRVHRDGSDTVSSPYKDISIRERNSLVEVKYKPARPRTRARRALFDPAKVADPRGLIEAALGKLAQFKLVRAASSPRMPISWPAACSAAAAMNMIGSGLSLVQFARMVRGRGPACHRRAWLGRCARS